jgi:Flp pilus assembly protein TadG
MRIARTLKNRGGATLAVVAVSLVALLAIMSLAIDMGMMYSARNEAQRVADAAALAGASAFCDDQPHLAVSRAQEYVTQNYVLGDMVALDEAEIDKDDLNERVTVTVRRQQIPTWFARIFGVDEVAVAASATAVCRAAGSATCVRPWAVQDLWFDQELGRRVNPNEDDVRYEPANNDYYAPANPSASPPTGTGYGADRNDNGMKIALKEQKPSGSYYAHPAPGEFLLWEMPPDPNLEACAKKGKEDNKAYTRTNSICACNSNPIYLGQEYDMRPGDVVGPNDQGFDALIEKDRHATWDKSLGMPCSPIYGCGTASPRVVTIALMAPLPPDRLKRQEMNKVTFTNFALMFIEDFDEEGKGSDKVSVITGRFMYYADGGDGPTTGALVKQLRLIN